MQTFKLKYNGQNYQTDANSPDEAVAKIKGFVGVGQTDKFDPYAAMGQNPADAISKGTGSGIAGAMVKPANYLTGLPGLAGTINKLGQITGDPSTLEAMSPQEKARLAAGTIAGGAGTVGAAAFGPASMLMGAAKAAPGLAIYNETGLGDKVNKKIDTALPDSPYLAEAAKMVPQVLAGAASTAPINKGLAAMGVGAEYKPVPKGEEANTLADMAKDKFEAPDDFAKGVDISQKGNFRQAFKENRGELGAEVGKAKSNISETIDSDKSWNRKDLASKVKGAITSALTEEKIAENPEAAAKLQSLADGLGNKISFATARGTATNIANTMKNTLKPGHVANSLDSPIWGEAKEAVGSVLDDHIEKYGQGSESGLASANKPFGQWATLQDLTNKAFSKGEFKPDTFITNWKSLSDADKLAKLSPEQVTAIDAMVKQPSPTMLQKLGNLVGKGAKLATHKIGIAGKLAQQLEPLPQETVFNAPTGKTPPKLGTDMGSASIASERENQLRKSQALKQRMRGF